MASVSNKRNTQKPWQRYARQRAVQALCILEAGDTTLLDGFPAFIADEYEETEFPDPGDVLSVRILAESIVLGAWHHRAGHDAKIAERVHNWTPARVGSVERAILRIAMHELYGELDSDERTPPKVVIDEAIELARYFVSDESAAFVNGVLDAVFKSQPVPLHPTP